MNYTIPEVELALRNAHMAKDEMAATRLAQELANMRDMQTKQMRGQTSSGATMRFGPWDTGVKLPQWADEGLAGMGRRMMEIGTLGNNPMKDETSDRLLNDSGAATVGALGADIAALAGGGAAVRAAGAAPAVVRAVPNLAKAVQSTGQAMLAPRSIPSAAAAGGLYSAATTEGGVDDRLIAGGVGMGAGALGQAAPRLVGSMVHNNVDPAVADLARRGVRMTPGQIAGGAWNEAEQKASGVVPWIGDLIKKGRIQSLQDFERAAYNEALAPVGKMVSGTGREAAKQAYDQMDVVYGKIVPKLRIGSDIDIQQRLMAIKGNLVGEYAERFEKFMANRFGSKFDPQNGLTGDAFKAVESELKREARRFGHSAIAAEQEYGEALMAARNEMIDVARKYSPASAMKALQKADLSYAKLERVGGAAEALGAKGGHFTPSQMLREVKQKEGSRLAFRKGEALMQDFAERADPILSSRIPDSGTPSRMALNALPFLGGATMSWPALGAYGGASLAFTEPARGMMQSTMLRQAKNPLAQEVANAMRLAAPYTSAAGMMLAPTIYSGQ